MPQHIGIVGCSAEGAALCYRTICTEGVQLLGPHAHPEVSMHTPSLANYVHCLNAGDLQGVGDLMLVSAHKLAALGLAFARPTEQERRETNRIIMDELVCGVVRPEAVAYFQQVIARLKDEEGCDAVILGCTEIPLIISDANSALPTLDSTRLLARAALQRAVSA